MKTILVGVSGGVAAFKSVQLVSDLVKKGYNVEVVMTSNATEFIQPMSFEALTNKPVMVDTFKRNYNTQSGTQHISVTKKADIFVVAPATANVIAKFANGIADDMLTSTFLAFDKTKIVAPAMNTGMLNNKATQRNIKQLIEDDIIIADSEVGFLACGDIGNGKMIKVPTLIEIIENTLNVSDKVLAGKSILVTAGPTQESIDPVRYITNHSSGKMGYAIARAAYSLGANVTLVSGPTNLEIPYGINLINVTSADDMYNAVINNYNTNDIIIKSAAVADFKPLNTSNEKIKKDTTYNLELTKNKDILSKLGQLKDKQFLCGFAMETSNLIENATNKLNKKNLDMIIANSLVEAGAGFKNDTNKVSIITKDKIETLDLMNKLDLAYEILYRINDRLGD